MPNKSISFIMKLNPVLGMNDKPAPKYPPIGHLGGS
jgi:hypothetical protein